MRTLFTFIVLGLIVIAGTAISQPGDQSRKSLTPKLVTEAPHLDGMIDDVWSQADSATDFFQLQPYFNQPPSHKTVAKILTTRDALYCLMICYDDREHISNVTGTLDNTTGDIVSVMFDTFNDKRSAYKLAVTASGVRADCRLLDDARDRDYTWDGIWTCASHIYDWGFVIEWEVPYKSLQYGKGLTSWGIDFDRYSPLRGEDLYWNSYAQNEGQRISRFGQLQFHDFLPSASGLNLEVYPLGIAKSTRQPDGTYKNEGSAGLDVFYNPSEALTFQMTANPDFAQIEADPFSFNITQYETHFSERRPFFTQGNEIFIAAGKQRNTGFYSPLELFYSRRIGRKLSDGNEVPLYLGTKAFGRADDWEYGGLLAVTGAKDYSSNGTTVTEPEAQFGVARVKKQVFGNSSLGGLFVGKKSAAGALGVVDVDGAFRTSDMQIAYQVARSFDNTAGNNGKGGYAVSAGLVSFSPSWVYLFRTRLIDNDFNVNEIGFVPWIGTSNFVGFTGPRWYFENGWIREFSFGVGPRITFKKVEEYTDRAATMFINMQLRANWGWEIDATLGRAKDNGVEHPSSDLEFSSWFNISPKWNGDIYGGLQHTYNFYRNYPGNYSWVGFDFDWVPYSILDVGTSFSANFEYKPDNSVEDITYDARPYLSVTPFNDFNVRMYVDNLFTQNSEHIDQILGGFLLSYNFRPKSWIYLALNDVHDRSPEFDTAGNQLDARTHVTAQAAVLKVKYLYYF